MAEPILKSLEGIPVDSTEFVAQLMLHNAQENLGIANCLQDAYLKRAQVAEATLSLIREHISDLFSGPYMPNPDYVLEALYPEPELIRLRADVEG